MTLQNWRDLAVLSVRDPADAARILMAMGFGTGVLWNALILMAVGNAILFSASNLFSTGPSPFPTYFDSPLIYFCIVAGGLALSALSIVWTGRIMGGTGTLANVLVLMVWMQFLRLLVQTVVLALAFIAPLMSALLVLATGLIGIYMLVHFINQAHKLGSPGKSVVVMLASFLTIAIGLSIVFLLVGGSNVGSTLEL